jgi:hypothetical protein
VSTLAARGVLAVFGLAENFGWLTQWRCSY